MDPDVDREYWLGRLTEMYGTSRAAAFILDAYNDAGECAPRLIRRFGITEGNRQTLSLGMTLDQLVNPDRYESLPDLWLSQSPPGERLQEYVDREWNRRPHHGETPPQIVNEVLEYSRNAVASIDSAEAEVTKNRAEFERLRNDIHCIRAMSEYYGAKVNAALLVLRYQRSRDISDMKRAAIFLAQSVEHYRALGPDDGACVRFRQFHANESPPHPAARRRRWQPANFHWTQLLSVYQDELAEFQAKVELLE